MSSERDYIIGILDKGTRIDGRGLLDYRDINIEYDVSKSAEGSVKVKIGDTEVITGVKLSIEKPYPDTPEEGGLMVNVELLPMSSPEFEPGPPSIDAIELARVVDRGLRESKAIDTKKLLIELAEKAWFVGIDVCPINDAGNLFDISALSAIASLKNTKFRPYDAEKNIIDYKGTTKDKLPLVKSPVSITVLKIGDHFIVDPVPEEERVMDARLTVATMADGTLCALQKGGNSPLSIEDINKMIEIGVEKGKELRKILDDSLKEK